jgi:hypothetical protein
MVPWNQRADAEDVAFCVVVLGSVGGVPIDFVNFRTGNYAGALFGWL